MSVDSDPTDAIRTKAAAFPEEPLSEAVWENWLEESYEQAAGSRAGK